MVDGETKTKLKIKLIFGNASLGLVPELPNINL